MIVDIVVGSILLVSAIIAFVRGFIREVLTILGVVGALAAAYMGGPFLTPLIETWLGISDGGEPQKLFDIVPYTAVATVLAYGSLFVVVMVILSLLSHFLAEAARSIGLGAVDRTMGVVFGLARGVLLLGILYLPVYLLVDQGEKDRWFNGSRTYTYLEQVASALESFLPAESVKAGDKIDLEDIKNTTRDRLEAIDVLKKGGLGDDEIEKLQQAGEGYSEEFRDGMDQIFEEQAGDEGADAVEAEAEGTINP